ncbi:lysylphosphatidylglycerol synthase transmembrane domain-containing protein [Ferrimicrobium sp.]|uniref:lysylphosphatidylglycerol synthase transmembrane domain-containing protein n=1 Tax=Ferrimicrobium sp. TaxID=2926050 RepID=UPI00260F75C9|nr:lysylphosphatidylglycerol synthase transmembrane domain-containing protein [Ferrimicrobium sp.]
MGPQQRSRRLLLRTLLSVIVIVVVFVLLFGSRSELIFALHRLTHLNFAWAFAAIGSEIASITCYALLQRQLLTLTGHHIRFASLFGLTLATDAIADSLPGEPLFSSAFRFTQYRRHGVDRSNAAWVMVAVLVALALGLSILLLIGASFAAILGQHGTPDLVLILVAIMLLVVMVIVLTRVSLWLWTLNLVARGIKYAPRRVRLPSERVLQRAHDMLAHFRIGPRDAGLLGLLGLGEWGFDLGCLILVFPALHLAIPWSSVVLAYSASQIVGILPITPGGLGTIEGSLSGVLVAFAVSTHDAITAVLVYRLISYWIIIAVGWTAFVVIWVLTRRETRHRANSAPSTLIDHGPMIDHEGGSNSSSCTHRR